MEKQISYIKGALIITLKNLEDLAIDQRETIRVLVPVNEIAAIRLIRY